MIPKRLSAVQPLLFSLFNSLTRPHQRFGMCGYLGSREPERFSQLIQIESFRFSSSIGAWKDDIDDRRALIGLKPFAFEVYRIAYRHPYFFQNFALYCVLERILNRVAEFDFASREC